MKYRILFIMLIIGLFVTAQTTKTAAELKKEMGKIMHETDWSNKAAADSANAKIAVLSKEMMMIGARQQAQQNGENSEQAEEKLKENVEYKMQLWNKMWQIAAQGDPTKFDLAQPLRDEIVEEYKEDENPTIKNPVWRDSMPDLTINMSQPQVQLIIDQMPVFRGIKRLIITCEKPGVPVNLNQILKNAENYPLTELYILNFGSSVNYLPAQVANFHALITLNLFNNNLSEIPESISALKSLKTLYLDINPLSQIYPVVKSLGNLKKLGLAKTRISDAEMEQIQQALPECKILIQ